MRTLLLIDVHALLYRFYHALPPLTSPPPGREPVGALYGLAGVLTTILFEERPDFIAAAFDRPEATLRKQEFPAYKAQRPAAPSDLVAQLAEVPNLFAASGVRAFSAPGYEADDVIGTLTQRFALAPELVTVILSGDHDVLQLVDGERVVARIIRTGLSNTVRYDEAAVREKYGFAPTLLPDYKGLVGDASDNIPGIPGIGEKTAAPLLKEFGALEEIYENIGLVPRKTADALLKAREQVFLSRKLARIVKDVPLPHFSLEELRRPAGGAEAFAAYCRARGFMSLVRRLGM